MLSPHKGSGERFIDLGFCMLSSECWCTQYSLFWAWHLNRTGEGLVNGLDIWVHGYNFVYLQLCGHFKIHSRFTDLSWLLKPSDRLSEACNSLKSNTCLGFMARESIMTCCLFPQPHRNTSGANSQCHLLSSYIIEELRFTEKKQLLNRYRVLMSEEMVGKWGVTQASSTNSVAPRCCKSLHCKWQSQDLVQR